MRAVFSGVLHHYPGVVFHHNFIDHLPEEADHTGQIRKFKQVYALHDSTSHSRRSGNAVWGLT